ncbi:MAG: hypothetical protein R3C05_02925 [Pirellulaceae bacterium]
MKLKQCLLGNCSQAHHRGTVSLPLSCNLMATVTIGEFGDGAYRINRFDVYPNAYVSGNATIDVNDTDVPELTLTITPA